jgi:protein SCO1/2
MAVQTPPDSPTDTPPLPERPARGHRTLLLIVVGVLFAGLCAGVFWLSERQAQKMGAGFPQLQEQTLSLTDQHGVMRSTEDFLGAPLAIFFGYTYCPDVCPMTLSVLQIAIDELSEDGIDASGLQLVFVTVDFERDTPEQLAAYLSLFDMPVTGLTGDAAALKAVQKSFGIYVRRVEDAEGVVLWDHSSAVYLYDRDGAFSGTIVFEEPADFVRQKLERLLR